MQPLPVASLHVLSIALCVAGTPVYDAARRALTFRCPLCAGSPFPSPTGKRTAEPDMRSEPSRRIDRSGMLDCAATVHVLAAHSRDSAWPARCWTSSRITPCVSKSVTAGRAPMMRLRLAIPPGHAKLKAKEMP